MRGRVRVAVAVAIVFVVASAAAAVVPMVRGVTSAGRPASASTTVVHGFACAEVRVVGAASDGSCDRMFADLERRSTLTDAQRRAAQPFVDALLEGLEREFGVDCPATGALCPVGAGTPTPDAVRRALHRAGFLSPVVRVARFEDPAPADAVVYGVRAGDGCLLGYLVSGVALPPRIEGPLPDSGCLFR